jgi:hypothetical protein
MNIDGVDNVFNVFPKRDFDGYRLKFLVQLEDILKASGKNIWHLTIEHLY